MTNKNSGRRGSPKGLRYRDDPPILGKIANALVSEPDAKIKSVIRAIGVEGDANIRRLERHFAAGKIQLMDDARKRAAPPPIVRHAEPHRHNHPLSFASEFELAKCRDATAAYRHLFDRLQQIGRAHV